MRKLIPVVLAAGSLALIGAGCGSSSNSSSGSSSTGATSTQSTQTEQSSNSTQTGTAAKPANGKKVTVDMHNIQFQPKAITVKKGTTVVWKNMDAVAHDVTKTGGPGPQFASGTGNLQQGDVYKQTFSTAGKITYVCTIHPGMDGTITVK
jgi:plastocyanin